MNLGNFLLNACKYNAASALISFVLVKISNFIMGLEDKPFTNVSVYI